MAKDLESPIESNASRSNNHFAPVHRHVTSHSKKGIAVFEDNIPSAAKWQHVGADAENPPMASFFLAYTTSGFPVDLNSSEPVNNDKNNSYNKLPLDIEQYHRNLLDPPSELIYDEASVFRYVDFAPATPAYMHRTQSIDYGIVIEGEMELILDSGERRRLKRGDSCVQRATMHAWRNTSDTEWARMVFVLISSKPLVINGKELGTATPLL